MGTIEQTGVDDRRPTTNETKMKMMLTTWMMLCLLLIGACAQAPPTPQDAPAAPATEAGDQGASGAVDSAETAEKPETIGEDCLPNENNEFVFKVNLWEYQYEVEGCEGVAPTLKIKRGVEYTFVQEDVSNWYHPLGLAYYPDGAHDGVPELEEPTPAECDEEDYMCNPGEGVQQAPLTYNLSKPLRRSTCSSLMETSSTLLPLKSTPLFHPTLSPSTETVKTRNSLNSSPVSSTSSARTPLPLSES